MLVLCPGTQMKCEMSITIHLLNGGEVSYIMDIYISVSNPFHLGYGRLFLNKTLALYFLMMAEAMRPSKYLLNRLMREHPLAECLAQSKVLNKCQLLPLCIIMCLNNGKQK